MKWLRYKPKKPVRIRILELFLWPVLKILSWWKKIDDYKCYCDNFLDKEGNLLSIFEVEELTDDHMQGGTSIGYARHLINAWFFLFLIITSTVVGHIGYCGYCWWTEKEIFRSQMIAIDNMPPIIQVEHKDKTSGNGKKMETNQAGNTTATFHLFEHLKIEFNLNSLEKSETKPSFFHDSIDRLLHLFKTETCQKNVIPNNAILKQLPKILSNITYNNGGHGVTALPFGKSHRASVPLCEIHQAPGYETSVQIGMSLFF